MRSEITQPGYGKGRASIDKGQRFPADSEALDLRPKDINHVRR